MAGAGVCPNMISRVQFLLNQDPGRCHAKCPRVQTHCKFRVFNAPVYKRASEALRDFPRQALSSKGPLRRHKAIEPLETVFLWIAKARKAR